MRGSGTGNPIEEDIPFDVLLPERPVSRQERLASIADMLILSLTTCFDGDKSAVT